MRGRGPKQRSGREAYPSHALAFPYGHQAHSPVSHPHRAAASLILLPQSPVSHPAPGSSLTLPACISPHSPARDAPSYRTFRIPPPSSRFLLEGIDFDQLGDALYRAPFVVLAHDRFQEGVTDPVFTYANHAALELWDATWEQLIGMPSRKSAADDPTAQQVG